MLNLSLVSQTLQDANPGPFGLKMAPNKSDVLAMTAAEQALGIGGGDGYSVASGGSLPGYGGGQPLPLALSPEERAQQKDRMLAIQGRDNEMSGLPCDKKARADKYRKEHNLLMMRMAQQGQGQLALAG
jgi:hypothetical protein